MSSLPRIPVRSHLPVGLVICLIGLAALAAGCRTSAPEPMPEPVPEPARPAPSHAVIPQPMTVRLDTTAAFTVTPETVIYVERGHAGARGVGEQLAALITTTRRPAPLVADDTTARAAGHVLITTEDADASLGPEGYTLEVTPEAVTLRAAETSGLFYGMQTLRQLLPPHVEYQAALPRPLTVPVGRITDRPRFLWRGAMLDVARHFRTVDEVKRYVDLMALYKLNRLHLHLSDDQGWRIEISGWPQLTEIGGSTEVGGGPGGFYTQADYAEIVRYAAERHVMIVPEIDMPGHINAALASVPELNCDGQAPPLYTGIKVGFSALCLEKDLTYTFIEDVVREIAALTPGPFFHLGGDEVRTLTDEAYDGFVRRVQGIIARHGKRPIGWDEIAEREAADAFVHATVVQWWRPLPDMPERLASAVERGAQIIASPADRFYLDMKYDSTTALGLQWAGRTDVATAYDADPAALLPGVPEAAILGVEAPLWAETTETMEDVEHLAFPRLAGVAEIGWSPARALDFAHYRPRLARHAPRWVALGLNFYRAPGIGWTE